MLEIDAKLTVNYLSLALVLMAMVVFGVMYAVLMRRLRRRDPQHGYTVAAGALGIAGVIVGFAALVGLDLGALLLALMAAAGMPVIYEFTDDQVRRAEGRRRALALKGLARGEHVLPSQNGGIHLETNGRSRPR